jgi:hypothetical protein
VLVDVAVLVAVGVRVLVGVAVAVFVGGTAVLVAVGVRVSVAVAVAVFVAGTVLVAVGVRVLVAVAMGVFVGTDVFVGVEVDVTAGVFVGVPVTVAVVVGAGPSPGISMWALSVACSGGKPPQMMLGFPPLVWVIRSATVVCPVTDGSMPSLMKLNNREYVGGWLPEVKLVVATTSPPMRMSARTVVESTVSLLERKIWNLYRVPLMSPTSDSGADHSHDPPGPRLITWPGWLANVHREALPQR